MPRRKFHKLARSARPLGMWAVVVRSTASEWIHWETFASTKKRAFEKYLEQFLPHTHGQVRDELAEGRLRLARIKISLA